MNAKAVKNKLVAIMQELEYPSGEVLTVKGFQEPLETQFPAIFIKAFGGMEKTRLDSVSDAVKYAFIVRAILPNDASEDGEDEILDLLDIILDKFVEYRDTLGGVAVKFDVESVAVVYNQDGIPLRALDFNISAVAIKTFTP
jgi:hypothetical protein